VHDEDTEVELPPFTPGMRQAIRECRFKTTNALRTVAIIYDADLAKIQATGCQSTRYERAPQSAPGVYDYEARSSDPRVIEFVAVTLNAPIASSSPLV
jgi:hypothetical protein